VLEELADERRGGTVFGEAAVWALACRSAINASQPLSHEAMVELVSLGCIECLFYKTFPINIGIIRATSADAEGSSGISRLVATATVSARQMGIRAPRRADSWR